MMKQTVLFILLFIVSIYCHAAGEVLLSSGGVPPILVFDNGNGITNLLAQFDGHIEYDVWGVDIVNPTFDSIVAAGYKLVLTGSGGNYGALATQMTTESAKWAEKTQKVVLSGQSVDQHRSDLDSQYGAELLLYNSLLWALEGHQQGSLNFVAFADTQTLWTWTPWVNSGMAAAGSGENVNVDGYESHMINDTTISSHEWPLWEGKYEDGGTPNFLSEWGYAYDAYFTTLPAGFSQISVTDEGYGITILNTNFIPIQIPEPTSILMLAFGTFLAIWLRFRKS